MSLWTQLDFILAFPLGAILFAVACAAVPVAIVALIGWAVMTRTAEQANTGWRESYAAWKGLDRVRRRYRHHRLTHVAWPPSEEPEEERRLH
jgi:hypothetical protein